MRRRLLAVIVMLAVLGLIGALYWPVSHGGFAWDDNTSFHGNAWLRSDAWPQFVLRGFNDWVNYFRPLVIVLFVAEVHLFEVAPEPMHVVSLGLHLANALLVGLLAARFASHLPQRTLWAALAALIYGLHPALIEPTAWIGGQFELTLLFFILVGLFLNASIGSVMLRASGVGLAFLLAAGCKESAVAFPLLLVAFDLHAAPGQNWPQRISATWQRQRTVYAAVLLAGIAYLALRYWALGYTVTASGTQPLLSFARLQKVCLTYLEYWRLIVWPMSNIGPIHPYDDRLFELLTPRSLACDVLAITIVLGGAVAFFRRHVAGTLIVAVTMALLPVLNLLPVSFNDDLYHDRYAATAVGVACVLLPPLLAPLLTNRRLLQGAAAMFTVVWLGFAAINIRATVPLWVDESGLWQWMLREHPDSVAAKDRLLSIYMARDDRPRARALANEIATRHIACVTCLLNAAYLAIGDGDAARAEQALDQVKDSNKLAYSARLLRGFVLANGQLLELRADTADAEEAYRDAMKLGAFDPQPPMALAMLLARQGRIAEARATAGIALALFAPDEREAERRSFEQVVAASSITGAH